MSLEENSTNSESVIKSKGFLDQIEEEPVKAIILGNSGTGKTGALASLVLAGYNLHILDFDKGVPILRNALGSPKSPYFSYLKQNNIDPNEKVFAIPLTEKMKVIGGKISPVTAQVWNKTGSLLEKFKTENFDKGNIGTWGLDTILVLDSLTLLGFAALWNVQALNQRLGDRFQGYDWMRDVGEAQNMIERLLQLLYSDAVKCHVIVISHITYVDDSKGVAVAPSRDPEALNLSVKGFPSSLGKALAPRLGQYFNNCFQVEQSGSGPSARRFIYTLTQGNVGLKSSAPFSLKPRYSIETGLAEIFAALRNQPDPTALIKKSESESWYKFNQQKSN